MVDFRDALSAILGCVDGVPHLRLLQARRADEKYHKKPSEQSCVRQVQLSKSYDTWTAEFLAALRKRKSVQTIVAQSRTAKLQVQTLQIWCFEPKIPFYAADALWRGVMHTFGQISKQWL